jgi:hypothetical protein
MLPSLDEFDPRATESDAKNLLVRFFTEPVEDKLSTEGGELDEQTATQWVRDNADDPRAQELRDQLSNPRRLPLQTYALKPAGRPIYREVERIMIMIPGDRGNVVVRDVIHGSHPRADTVRFARIYADFKRQAEAPTVGTPLSVLATIVPPILTLSLVEEFKHFHIQTAEQLIGMADVHGQKFPGFQNLKRKVQAYLDAAQADVPNAHLRTELDKRDQEITVLKQQMAELLADRKAEKQRKAV